MMVKAYHKHNILHGLPRQKRYGKRARLRAKTTAGRTALLTVLLLLGACDPVEIVEGSDTHVSIRYDGITNGLDRATELANNACAAHGKTARLRRTYYEGLGVGERFAFFDCV
jgi:hypothetical protein